MSRGRGDGIITPIPGLKTPKQFQPGLVYPTALTPGQELWVNVGPVGQYVAFTASILTGTTGTQRWGRTWLQATSPASSHPAVGASGFQWADSPDATNYVIQQATDTSFVIMSDATHPLPADLVNTVNGDRYIQVNMPGNSYQLQHWHNGAVVGTWSVSGGVQNNGPWVYLLASARVGGMTNILIRRATVADFV